MKKIFLTLAAIVCYAMTTVVFTSCGGDDSSSGGGSGGGDEPDVTPAGVELYASFTVDAETFTYFDMTVEYFDIAGNLKSEPMTSKDWEKTIIAPLPAKVGARLKIALKEDTPLDDNKKYNFDWIFSRTCFIVNKSGKCLDSSSSLTISSKGFTDKLGSIIKENVAKNYPDGVLFDLVYEVDSQGKKTKGSW